MKTTRHWFSPLALALVTAAPVIAPGCATPDGVAPVLARDRTTKPEPGVDPEKLMIEARFEPAVARAGEAVRLVLHATTAEGWHAYGSLEETNVPIALDRSKIQFGGLEPEGEPIIPTGDATKMFGVMMFPLPSVFDVAQAVRVPAGARPGEVAVAGKLDYQICDENSCDAPTEVAFTAKLTVEAGEARAKDVLMLAARPPGHTIVLDNRAKAIEVAKAEDKLLLYNFTGFNCASCRVMESMVLGDSSVAGTMAAHFVESRQHTDTQNTLTDAQFADNKKAQAELAGTVATPYFIVVDPKTGKKISEHALSGGPSVWTGEWARFLEQTLARAGR